MSRGKILFLATEDWFVRSHFLPLLRRAKAEGFEIIVAARGSGALQGEDGVRFIDMPFARRSLAPGDIWREARAVRALLHTERPSVVHAIALKSIAIALLTGERPSIPRVLALTGRGYLEARGGWRRLILEALARLMRAAVQRGHAVLVTENQADRRWVEGSSALPAARLLYTPGSGVDPDAFTPSPEPGEPIVVGVAARLVRSKGIDVAVEASRRLRDSGVRIELHIAGVADADNPEHVNEAEIVAWRATDGVRMLGRVSDVNAFWSGVHIACLPSRGGEGLPRALLEAAACGRPIVTTDAPGCGDFVVNKETGLVVPRDDVDALAAALATLAQDAGQRRRMGAAGRVRVLSGFTEAHAAAVAAEAWRLCLPGRS